MIESLIHEPTEWRVEGRTMRKTHDWLESIEGSRLDAPDREDHRQETVHLSEEEELVVPESDAGVQDEAVVVVLQDTPGTEFTVPCTVWEKQMTEGAAGFALPVKPRVVVVSLDRMDGSQEMIVVVLQLQFWMVENNLETRPQKAAKSNEQRTPAKVKDEPVQAQTSRRFSAIACTVSSLQNSPRCQREASDAGT